MGHAQFLLLTLVALAAGGDAPSLKQGEQAADTRVRGHWVDPSTGLMWAGRDNFGRDLNWRQAGKYCGALRLAGHADWRLPTIGELEAIFDRRANALGLGGKRNERSYPFHVKGDLFLTGDSWSAPTMATTSTSSPIPALRSHRNQRGGMSLNSTLRARAHHDPRHGEWPRNEDSACIR